MSTDIVKINRGDSFEMSIVVPDKENYYKKHLLATNEMIYFAVVYPHQQLKDALILKGYDLRDQNTKTGEIKINITSSDTRLLAPGIYYYFVKLQRGGTLGVIDDFDEPDEVRTIIERTKFIINE